MSQWKFGKLDIVGKNLLTNNDSYALESITAVSTRRPFLAAGLMIGTLTGLFGLAFYDILYTGEVIGLTTVTVLSIAVGVSIGQFKLVSRDLSGTPLADAGYGFYWELAHKRPEVMDARDRARENEAKTHEARS